MILIDGHNVFFALNKDKSHDFEKDLSQWVDDCLIKCDIQGKKFILVMDGSGGGHPLGLERSSGSHGRLVYSGNSTADEWIQNWVYRNAQESVLLVSKDLRLYEHIRSKRVKREDPEKWWRSLKRKKPSVGHKASTQGTSKKGFGSTDEWLEFFGEKP